MSEENKDNQLSEEELTENSVQEPDTAPQPQDSDADKMSGESDKEAEEEKHGKGIRFKRKPKAKNSKEEELRMELEELKDKHLRLFSEFDNYRKRTLREKADLLKMASSEVLTSMLPVLDDFERALGSFDKSTDKDALRKGVDLIYSKFRNILTRNGLEPIESIGQPFDTDLHEAITNIPATDQDMKGKIVDEIEKGYMLQGKVLRYAKVVVGS